MRVAPWSNPWLLAAVLFSLALQLAVVYVDPLQPIFKTTGLTATELLVCLTVPWVVLVVVEVEKWLARRGLIYRDRPPSSIRLASKSGKGEWRS